MHRGHIQNAGGRNLRCIYMRCWLRRTLQGRTMLSKQRLYHLSFRLSPFSFSSFIFILAYVSPFFLFLCLLFLITYYFFLLSIYLNFYLFVVSLIYSSNYFLFSYFSVCVFFCRSWLNFLTLFISVVSASWDKKYSFAVF